MARFTPLVRFTPLYPKTNMFSPLTPSSLPIQVKATDADGPGNDSKITYSIRDGNGLGRFTIDPQDGVIRTNERLDRETQSLYWLTVYAQDSGAVPLFRYLDW